MIWSFLRIVIFVALVAGLTLAAGHLAETGEGIRISIANTEFTLGPVQTIVALVAALVALWLVLKLVGLAVATLRFVNGDETAISRYFDRNRERKGFKALADGMIALASGEGRLAMSQAARAEKYLARPDLTDMLAAQAAELAGEPRRAGEIYKRLLADDRTRFVGIRGLMKQKLAEGDDATALRLAQKAFALKPRHEEVQDTLLRLQTRAGDWGGARQVLGAKARHGLLPRDVHRRRDAVLALQEARTLLSDDTGIDAKEAAIAANRQSPDLVPAAVMAADSYVAQGKPKNAVRVLRTAWNAQPHPDLAAAFARILPDESPAGRLKRFETLLSLQPEHEESRLLRAELCIAAEDFPAARRAIGDIPTRHPSVRALTIMAAIERGEGSDDAVVRGWLARALTAPRGPEWVCDKCGHAHADWVPICAACGSFDTLAWREAENAAPAVANGADMLPLIVGGPASASDTPADDLSADDSARRADDRPRPVAVDGEDLTDVT